MATPEDPRPDDETAPDDVKRLANQGVLLVALIMLLAVLLLVEQCIKVG